MSVQVVILAAGQGKRMKSSLPKVLHCLAGIPLIEHVLKTAARVSTKPPILIYGHEGERLQQAVANYNLTWVEQAEQLGTGHAMLQAMPFVSSEDHVLILCGDVPLISEKTLQRLIETTSKDQVGLITANLSQPFGYGRIIRDAQNRVTNIVEEKDASETERAIKEINTSIYLIPCGKLKAWLPKIKNHNGQQEYYLTDIIPLALKEGVVIHTIQPECEEEILGVNDKIQLANLERFYQAKMVKSLMLQGVTFYDPARVDIRGDITIGRDVTIDVNVILEGKVIIGDGCCIGPYCLLKNSTLGEEVEIKSHSIVDGAIIGTRSRIGPFARLRPETELAEDVHIGNFVEVKKTKIAKGSKANHLTYLGDCEIGQDVNVGAGVITCNYDGVNKHKTFIADDAFIGSGTQLVAPVGIGAGATIGAGSTITKDAPAHQLTLSRAPQQTVENWQRPQKIKMKENR